jgi:hypothetical protein
MIFWNALRGIALSHCGACVINNLEAGRDLENLQPVRENHVDDTPCGAVPFPASIRDSYGHQNTQSEPQRRGEQENACPAIKPGQYVEAALAGRTSVG